MTPFFVVFFVSNYKTLKDPYIIFNIYNPAVLVKFVPDPLRNIENKNQNLV